MFESGTSSNTTLLPLSLLKRYSSSKKMALSQQILIVLQGGKSSIQSSLLDIDNMHL